MNWRSTTVCSPTRSPSVKRRAPRRPSAPTQWPSNGWASATFVRRLPHSEVGAPELDAYQFRDAAGNTFYVAWLNPVELGEDTNGNGTPDTPAEFESLRLPVKHAEVYNIYGQRTEVVQDNDGDIRVLVGAQPVYIKVIN